MVDGYYLTDYDIQVTGSTASFNPLGTKLYNNLLINPRADETECEMCAEWQLENGGKTMVFTLIQGIKFHNGHELTSADVKWSLRKIMGEVDGIPSPRVGVIKEYIESIETPSKYVLKLNLIRPSAFVPKVLSMNHAVIYPDGTTRTDLKDKPIGSGPYILTQAIPGSTRKLDRNPNYFKPGLPYLDGVDQVFVSDTTTIQANFFTHKTQITSNDLPQYRSLFTKMLEEGRINFAAGYGCGGAVAVYMNNAEPPFNDLTMRKAVNLALNRKTLGNLMLQGVEKPQLVGGYTENMEFGTPAEQIWDVVPGWGTGAKKQQEIEEAKRLMVQAGFPSGMDIDQMARSPLATFGITAGSEAVQQQLREVGIRTTLSLVDGTVHQNRMASQDYLIQQYVFCQATNDPDEAVGSYWITGASRNWIGYSNPDVDRLFPLMSGELDPVKRKQLFLQLQKVIVQDTVGYAPLSTLNQSVYWWKSLRGFAMGRDGIGHGASGWHRGDRIWLKEQ